LARRLKGAGVPTVNALHPGVVRTELGRYLLSDDASFLTKAMWWAAAHDSLRMRYDTQLLSG
jgi:NAD(P)-dependent dehydrogenase (short-subunit alcohol dehydrogenase family)